jgi:hypothetical protein
MTELSSGSEVKVLTGLLPSYPSIFGILSHGAVWPQSWLILALAKFTNSLWGPFFK